MGGKGLNHQYTVNKPYGYMGIPHDASVNLDKASAPPHTPLTSWVGNIFIKKQNEKTTTAI